MNGDKETFQQPEDRQPETDGSPENIPPERSASPPPYSPPPPSVLAEFLTAQWLTPMPAPADADTEAARLALTPPPPSAPGEFLEAQWREDAAAGQESLGAGPDVFADALPSVIQSVEELNLLMEEVLHAAVQPSPPERDESDKADSGPPVRIRGVPLARGEEITQVFLPDKGLSADLPPSGQALILTSRRLIAFRGVEGFRDTHLAMASEISQFSVRTGQRNWGAILQGFMVMLGGGLLYIIVAYWLAGQISGPNVPVLNMDVAPFIALLIILAGLLVLLQNYFTRPAGAVIFHGEGVEFAFPFRSSLDVRQVYDFVDLTHVARCRANTEKPEADRPN